MGRWTQYDEDSYRLPQGMRRVGYDADEGRYYFRDSAGLLWQGAQGAQFSEMTQVGSAPVVLDDLHEEDADLEAAGRRADGYQPLAPDAGASPHQSRGLNYQAYRTMFPFFMIIVVVLLLVWRLVGPFSHAEPPEVTFCTGDTRPYRVVPGDTCWDISQTHGFTLKQLREANPGLNCDLLTASEMICLPPRNTRRR